MRLRTKVGRSMRSQDGKKAVSAQMGINGWRATVMFVGQIALTAANAAAQGTFRRARTSSSSG